MESLFGMAKKKMKKTKTNMKYYRSSVLPDIIAFIPTVYEDERGCFFESYNSILRDLMNADIVQENHSVSNKDVLRGLHYQWDKPMGKLCRAVRGKLMDYVVDIRKDSPTYGQFVAEELTASNKRMLFIPPGFAHGFATLEDNTIFTYKCTDYYHPEAEGGILWNSPSLNIPWRLENPVLSAKDEQLTDFAHFNSPF